MDSLLDLVEVLLGLLVGVGVVIGQIYLFSFLYCKLEVKFKAVFCLYPLHVLQLCFLVCYQRRPTFAVLLADTNPVHFIKLFILCVLLMYIGEVLENLHVFDDNWD